MYNETWKNYIYKWRELNPEKYKEIARKNSMDYKNRNKEKIKAKYQFKKEWKQLCEISI
jgi:hypothetical protein